MTPTAFSRLALTLAFIACGSLAVAQTSTGLVQTNRQSQYQLIKKAYQETEISPDSAHPPRRKLSVDIVDCIYSSPQVLTPALSQEEERKDDVVVLAVEVAEAAATLEWSGYPPTLWQDDLERYEREQISSSTISQSRRERFASRMVAKLKKYRKSNPSLPLPALSWETGCGGMGVRVTIRTKPHGGRVSLLPVFFYRLCIAQTLDPDNPDQCDRWEDYSEDEETFLEGAYMYRARWKTGKPLPGRRKDFSNVKTFDYQWTVEQD